MSLVQEQNLAGEHAFTYPLRLKFYAKFVLCFAFDFEMQTSFLFTLSSVTHDHVDTSTKAMETEPVWGLF